MLWLDSARHYRRLFPNEKITLIANSAWADYARYFPYWDDVWPLNLKLFGTKSLFRWRILCRVQLARFKTAIQPTFSRVLSQGDSIINASSAIRRIGSVGDLTNIASDERDRSDRWYTHLFPASNQLLMELERNVEFLGYLTSSPVSSDVASLPTTPIDLSRFGLPESYFVIFPGASYFKRMWPVDRFASLANWLHGRTGWTMVLCGGRDEASLGSQIQCLYATGAINIIGKTSLAEFIEVARNAKLLIANETSAIHIAAAVGTQSVCILGGGHYGRFMPYPEGVSGVKPLPANVEMDCYGCNWSCTMEHPPEECWPCISAISLENVQQRVSSLLDAQ